MARCVSFHKHNCRQRIACDTTSNTHYLYLLIVYTHNYMLCPSELNLFFLRIRYVMRYVYDSVKCRMRRVRIGICFLMGRGVERVESCKKNMYMRGNLSWWCWYFYVFDYDVVNNAFHDKNKLYYFHFDFHHLCVCARILSGFVVASRWNLCWCKLEPYKLFPDS